MRTTRQLSITLPNDMADGLRERVRSGEYASESEVIREGLRALFARDQAVEAWLRDEVAAAYDAVIADPRRMALAEKVEVRHDPAITARGAKSRHVVRVEVHLTDGTVHAETVEAPRGSEKRFATDQDVINKFRKLAGTRLANRQVDRIVDLVMNAERMASARELATALGT